MNAPWYDEDYRCWFKLKETFPDGRYAVIQCHEKGDVGYALKPGVDSKEGIGATRDGEAISYVTDWNTEQILARRVLALEADARGLGITIGELSQQLADLGVE